MRRQPAAYLLFGSGVLLLFIHTTLPALWQLFGPPGDYPLASTEGPLVMASGFTPVVGAVLMLFGGLVHGSRPRRADR